MALSKFFRFPFGTTGDRVPVPDATQPGGDVSYQQGYGPDYSRNPASDPLAKNIERDKMNQVLYDVTAALREYQTTGTPDYITAAQNGGAPFPYSRFAKVRYDSGTGTKVYISQIDNNTDLPTVTSSWSEEGPFIFNTFLATQAQAEAGTDNSTYMSPLRVAQAVPGATTTVAGRVELATDAEVQAGTDSTRAVTPSALVTRTATDTRAGLVELATNVETTAGTSTTLAVTPSGVKAATSLLAPIQDPLFTGNPRAPTPGQDNNTNAIITGAYYFGQASIVNPLMNGTAAVGTSYRFSRQDHVHPSDTSKVSFIDFAFSNTANGYMRFPGGLSIQWGSFDPGTLTNGQTGSQSFPISFTTTHTVVVGSAAGNITATAEDDGFEATSFTTAGFSWISRWSSRPNTFPPIRWMAVGYIA